MLIWEIFFEKYKQKVVGNTPTSVYTLLEDDIGLPYPGMLYTRPLAKYIIFKEFFKFKSKGCVLL